MNKNLLEMMAPLDRKVLILLDKEPGISDDEICIKLDIPSTYLVLVANRLFALGLVKARLPVPAKYRN